MRACADPGLGLGNPESAAASLALSPRGTTCEGFPGSVLPCGRGGVCISAVLLCLPEPPLSTPLVTSRDQETGHFGQVHRLANRKMLVKLWRIWLGRPYSLIF